MIAFIGVPELLMMVPVVGLVVGFFMLLARSRKLSGTNDEFAKRQPSQTPRSDAHLIVREREVIREVVKIPCPYCSTLVESTEARCAQCGAPQRR